MRTAVLRAAIAGAAAALLAVGAVAGPYRAPRTSDGHPDLQGMWTNASMTPLQRPPQFKTLEISDAEARAYEASPPPLVTDNVGGNETEQWERGTGLARVRGRARSSLVVEPADGLLPFTPEGRSTFEAAVRRAVSDVGGPEPRTNSERCLLSNTTGPPMLAAPYNNNIQIVQTPEAIVFVLEWNHEARIVRLGDRRRLPASVRLWMGDAVGRWEGDTLVVETTNFNSIQVIRRGATSNYYVSPEAKVIERFTRTSPTEILYQFEVDDPATYSKPWRGEEPFAATSARSYEFACHEGNYALPDILAGARAIEREAAAARAPSVKAAAQ